MKQPPYTSSIRLVMPHRFKAIPALQAKLSQQPGVSEVVIVVDEMSVYVKVDKKLTSREQLESIVNAE